MTSQGKSLQDIYDDGASALDNLVQKEKASLGTSAEAAIAENESHESSVMKRLEDATAEFDGDIRSSVERAVEEIRSTIDSERSENERFLERLKEELRLSCQVLGDEINQLSKAALEKLSSRNENGLAMQERGMDKAVVGLAEQGTRIANKLKAQSDQDLRSTANNVSSKLLRVEETASKLPLELFDKRSKNENDIEHKLHSVSETLRGKGEETRGQIKTESERIDESLSSRAYQMVAEMESDGRQCEADLRDCFEKACKEVFGVQGALSARSLQELNENFSQKQTNLSKRLKELRSQTDGLVEQLKSRVVDLDAEVRKKSTDGCQSYANDVKQRLDAARNRQVEIEQERRQLMMRLMDDMRNLESDFEKRLIDLSQRCLDKLSTTCRDAESAIVSIHDSCAGEFKSIAENQKNGMDSKSGELLNRIEVLGSKAVDAIRLAAGEDAPQSQSQASGKPAPANKSTDTTDAGDSPA